MRLLECDPNVLEYREQPCVIRYRLGGTTYRHIPDELVRTASASTLYEVKTSKDARRVDVVARSELLTRLLPHHGYQYRVVLAEDLRREPRLRNARLLLRYGRAPLTFEQRELIRRLTLDGRELRWADIANGAFAPFSMWQACRLVLEGTAALDLERPLDSQYLRLRGTHAESAGDKNVEGISSGQR